VTDPTPLTTEIVSSYRGREFRVKKDFTFEVIEGDERAKRRLNSIYDVRSYIDDLINSEAKIAQKKIKVDVPVLTHDGKQDEIKGISRTSSRVMLRDAGVIEHDFYPDVPWVREAVRRRAALQKEVVEIGERLHGLSINAGRRYGSMEASDYPKAIERLLADVQKATLAAIEKGPKK
jgi:hypothetical protein